jgi:hypothetical protein
MNNFYGNQHHENWVLGGLIWGALGLLLLCSCAPAACPVATLPPGFACPYGSVVLVPTDRVLADHEMCRGVPP